MAMPFTHSDLEKLKQFTDFVANNPTILNFPQLDFVKNLIEKFGGKVPTGTFEMPKDGSCPFTGTGAAKDKKEKEPSDESEEENEMDMESELELDMEGVIEGDAEEPQEMGDETKIATDEDIDKAQDLRKQAAEQYSEQKYEEAIKLYTEAIKIYPGNALFHAKRGQCYLKLQKPNACIRDCDKALEINCDSAAAYKFRGRAYRLLGKWEEAAKDLRQACKLDFDEEADEWLREVTPNAKKIEQHRIKQGRKQAERKAKSARKPRQEKETSSPFNFPGFQEAAGGGPGGFPGNFNFPGGAGAGNLGSLLSDIQDPEVAAALKDIATNPGNIEKYKNNPKVAKLIDVIKSMTDKGQMPNFPGFPGFGAQPEPKATAPPKSDSMDDGLD